MEEATHPDPIAPSLSKRAICTQAQDAEPPIGNENGSGEARPDAERCTNTIPLTGPDTIPAAGRGGRTTGVVSSPDAARAATQDNGRESEVTRMIAQEENEEKDLDFHANDSLLATWCNGTLQIAQKINAERLSSRDNNNRLRQELNTLEGHLNVIGDEVKNMRKTKEKLTTQLKDTQCKNKRVGNQFAQDKDISKRVKLDLGKQLKSMRRQRHLLLQENDRLWSSLQTTQKSLEEEKEKTLCQICLESPKDTICHPCLHLHYCFACLEKHRKQQNSCPCCRMGITGTVKLDTSIW